MNELTLETPMAALTLKEFLERLKDYFTEIVCIQKDVLTMDDAVIYTGLSKSYLYKLTAGRKIPHFKTGKLIYFSRTELNGWMLQHPVATDDELETEALRRMYAGNESRSNRLKYC